MPPSIGITTRDQRPARAFSSASVPTVGGAGSRSGAGAYAVSPGASSIVFTSTCVPPTDWTWGGFEYGRPVKTTRLSAKGQKRAWGR
ncbi:MAG: hypothetical protein H6704_27240 [Myxococcales bacterium]|nr:hypothetical protein [Myxococcales bacterium]